LSDGGRCPRHRSAARKDSDARRGSASERGYGPRWQKTSNGYLRAHPLCQCSECDEGRKRVTVATVVDHKVPPRLKHAFDSGDQSAVDRAMRLFWDSNNWQAMSKTCHDRKTAREDGGFGHLAG